MGDVSISDGFWAVLTDRSEEGFLISRGLRPNLSSGFSFFSSLSPMQWCGCWIIFFFTATVNIKDLPMGELLPGGYVDPEVGIAVLLFRPVMAIPTLSATARRLHDIGKSGWWSCLWVFPCQFWAGSGSFRGCCGPVRQISQPE